MAASERLELRVSREWLAVLDGARGGVARGTFVKQVVEKALGSPLGASVSADEASKQPLPGASSLVARGRATGRPKEEPTSSRSASSRSSASPLAGRQAALNKAKGL